MLDLSRKACLSQLLNPDNTKDKSQSGQRNREILNLCSLGVETKRKVRIF